MKRLLPLVIFVAVAFLCQCVSIITAIILDDLDFHWFSIVAFGGLYLVMFVVAWKITVFVVDTYLVPRGYVEGGVKREAPVAGAKLEGTAGADKSRDLAA